MGSFSEGLAAVRPGGRIDSIDRTGREVIPPEYPEYEGLQGFSGGVAKVWRDGAEFYISRDGTEYYDP